MLKLRKLDKKGVLGLDTAKLFIIAILTLAVVAFAVIVALNALNTNSGLTGTAAAQAGAIFNNVSGGTANFFGNAATWFALLAVVIIILIIAVVIVAVNRFGGRGGGL